MECLECGSQLSDHVCIACVRGETAAYILLSIAIIVAVSAFAYFIYSMHRKLEDCMYNIDLLNRRVNHIRYGKEEKK